MKKLIYINKTAILIYIIYLVLISSCNTSKTNTNAKLNLDTANLLVKLKTDSFNIDIHTVIPFTTAATQRVLNKVFVNVGNSNGRINVEGDGNYISIKNNHIKADLPFFGEQRQFTGNYGQAISGIKFNSMPKDYTISPHKKKEAIIITFVIEDSKTNTENYNIDLIVFPNKHVDVFIRSSHRTLINYLGTLDFVEEEA